MAMSEQQRRSRVVCERYASALALLDDASTDPDAREAALDHLAACPWCQADRAVDARLDRTLRRAFGACATSPLRTSDLLVAIGATSEPAAMPRWATDARGETIRSVVYLGDFDDVGGFSRMSEQDERVSDDELRGQSARDDGGSVATSARRMAAIPSLHPERRRIGRQAMTLGFGATAVAVALIVVAVTLFGSRGHLAPARTAHASATQTASAQRTIGASFGPIVAISMDASNDGWALGDATSRQAGPVDPVAALYHYDGSNWRLAQVVKGFSVYAEEPASLKMLSTTDGWAFSDAPGSLLHYDGTSWRPVTIAPNGARVLALDMESPTDGWAAAQGGDNMPLNFLHYDGRQWTLDADVATPPGLDTNQLVISGISSSGGGDVWAVGYDAVQEPAQFSGVAPSVGLIFHRVGGVWQLASRLNAPTAAAANIFPRGILMLSPTSGWIAGDSSQTTTTTEVGGSSVTMAATHALLLHYNGAHWTPVSVPLSTPSGSDQLSQIVATAPDSVWVMATSNAQTILPNGVAFSGDVLHYDGTAWSEVRPSVTPTGVTSVMLTALSSGGDGTLWAIGMTSLPHSEGGFFCRYVGGVWQIVQPVTGGA
ncbi:MAG TPA: hypothetical protein VFN78_09965, partial [Ktedonobacterales bacterium]|nr:hypothetical protein [Ktedonobacterales bacterium]